jgi:hypothetical protein
MELAEALAALAKSITALDENQKKIVEKLDKLQAKGTYDPAKLVANTNDVKTIAAGLGVVQPKDPTQPNLTEPLPPDNFGNIPQRICWKCNQAYAGIRHC